MSERYWVTGVQLGLLKEDVLDVRARNRLIDKIIDKQFIGNYFSDEAQKQFEEKIKQL